MITEYYNEEGYLLVKVGIPWTTKTAKQMIDEARIEATKHKQYRILFDLTQWTQPDSDMTRFNSGEYLATVFTYPFKVAAFALPAAINKFGENTAVNRGAWFRIFPGKAQAIEWLMQEPNKSDAGDASQLA